MSVFYSWYGSGGGSWYDVIDPGLSIGLNEIQVKTYVATAKHVTARTVTSKRSRCRLKKSATFQSPIKWLVSEDKREIATQQEGEMISRESKRDSRAYVRGGGASVARRKVRYFI